MSVIKVSGNTGGTGIFHLRAPNSSTDRFIDLPDNTGTVITTESTQSKAPLLSVTFARDTSGASGTYFEFDTSGTPAVDTHSYWSTSTHRYTPLVAGYYLATGGANVQDHYWAGARPVKNFAGTAVYSAGALWPRTIDNEYDNPGWGQGIFSMNGSTDYISLAGLAYGGSSKNFDQGYLIIQFLRSL